MIFSLLHGVATCSPRNVFSKSSCASKLTQRNDSRGQEVKSGAANVSKCSNSKITFEINACKTKTRKSASKRYKITPSGKVNLILKC
jgi:hypothetical protein